MPIRELWTPASARAELLPYLAWTDRVDVWDENWPEGFKRRLIADSVLIHRRKGTVWAVKQVMALAGATVGADGVGLEEWFTDPERMGPRTFRLRLPANHPVLTAGAQRQRTLYALIEATKPVAAHWWAIAEGDGRAPHRVNAGGVGRCSDRRDHTIAGPGLSGASQDLCQWNGAVVQTRLLPLRLPLAPIALRAGMLGRNVPLYRPPRPFLNAFRRPLPPGEIDTSTGMPKVVDQGQVLVGSGAVLGARGSDHQRHGGVLCLQGTWSGVVGGHSRQLLAGLAVRVRARGGGAVIGSNKAFYCPPDAAVRLIRRPIPKGVEPDRNGLPVFPADGQATSRASAGLVSQCSDTRPPTDRVHASNHAHAAAFAVLRQPAPEASPAWRHLLATLLRQPLKARPRPFRLVWHPAAVHPFAPRGEDAYILPPLTKGPEMTEILAPVTQYYSPTPGAVPAPANMETAQLAINLADKLLFTKDHNGAVIQLFDGVYATQTYVDGTFVALTDKGVADGVASLDANGKIHTSQLPALAITDTHPVASETEMLALVAQKGDIAIRTDEGKSYVLGGDDPTLLANWTELKSPTAPVQSVNGQTGTISLSAADVGAADIGHTHTAEEISGLGTLAQQNAANVAITGGTLTGVTLDGVTMTNVKFVAGTHRCGRSPSRWHSRPGALRPRVGNPSSCSPWNWQPIPAPDASGSVIRTASRYCWSPSNHTGRSSSGSSSWNGNWMP